jgi:hypothetical protein
MKTNVFFPTKFVVLSTKKLNAFHPIINSTNFVNFYGNFCQILEITNLKKKS